MDHTTTEKWSSLEEIAEHLGVSKDTIYRWIVNLQINPTLVSQNNLGQESIIM